MCGIIGTYKGRLSRAMSETIRHRGINDTTHFKNDELEIYHHRLAIIDPNNGSQPKVSGKWTVWLTGCIYNHLELRSNKDKYHSHSDTQTIAVGISNEGIGFIKKLNGMFIIVAYNGHDLFVCTDRYGIKPFYTWQNKGATYFSNEIKSFIQHPNFKVKVNQNALNQWFMYQNTLDNSTLFDGVELMDSGTIWNITTGAKEKYWKWESNPQAIDYDEARYKLRGLFYKACNSQTIGNKYPVSFHSGGIDSNCINSVFPPMPALTASYEGKYDETELAKIQPIHHYTQSFTKKWLVHNTSDHVKTINALEDLRLANCMVNYQMFDFASKFSNIVLEGAGGDELFYGYTWRHEAKDYFPIVNRTRHYIEGGVGAYKEAMSKWNREQFDQNVFLRGLFVVSDKLSMAHGIENRVPFLDNDFVDFVLTLPKEYRYNKRILKDAIDLNERIKNAPKKGWSTPKYPYEIEGIYKDYIDVEDNTWTAYAFELWMKNFL